MNFEVDKGEIMAYDESRTDVLLNGGLNDGNQKR